MASPAVTSWPTSTSMSEGGCRSCSSRSRARSRCGCRRRRRQPASTTVPLPAAMTLGPLGGCEVHAGVVARCSSAGPARRTRCRSLLPSTGVTRALGHRPPGRRPPLPRRWQHPVGTRHRPRSPSAAAASSAASGGCSLSGGVFVFGKRRVRLPRPTDSSSASASACAASAAARSSCDGAAGQGAGHARWRRRQRPWPRVATCVVGLRRPASSLVGLHCQLRRPPAATRSVASIAASWRLVELRPERRRARPALSSAAFAPQPATSSAVTSASTSTSEASHLRGGLGDDLLGASSAGATCADHPGQPPTASSAVLSRWRPWSSPGLVSPPPRRPRTGAHLVAPGAASGRKAPPGPPAGEARLRQPGPEPRRRPAHGLADRGLLGRAALAGLAAGCGRCAGDDPDGQDCPSAALDHRQAG